MKLEIFGKTIKEANNWKEIRDELYEMVINNEIPGIFVKTTKEELINEY